jgi:serine/threonine-protein kinase
VPPNIDAATAKALEKLPADRFASAAEFRGALTDAGFTTPTMGATAGVAPPRARRDPLVIGLAVALAVSTAVAAWALLRPAPAPAVARYSILLPDTGRLAEGFFARVALAPDGSRFVYAGGAQNNRSQLWVRMRDELRAEPLAGTDGGFLPFFSPDGKEVGFMSSGGIRAVAVRGGAGRTIASSRVSGWGASWGSDGYIYADGPGLDPIQRIPEGGGDWEPFTRLEGGVSDDHAFPHVLPNGKGVLFVIRHGATAGDPEMAVADIRTGTHRVLFPGVYAVYANSGHIVYANGQGDLLAVPFDQDRLELTGDPVSFASGLLGSSNVSLDLTISDDGTLMYVKGSGPGQMERGEPVWVHRDGREEPMVADWTTEAVYVSLSPDQTRLAATINSGTEGIWIRDFTRGTVSKLTFEGGLNRRPEWSPDSREVVFVSDRSGQLEIFAQRADGGAPPERLLRHGNLLQEALYTADGQWMVYRAGGGAGSNLYALRRDGDTIPLPLAVTGFQETAPAVSRDGKWLAYVSDETGSYEVYVRPFPDVERGKWLVSVAGGIEPAWSHDGSELFYRNRNHEMVAVEVLPAATPPTGRQQVLFDAGKYSSDIYHSPWDVAADGQRFAMIRARETDLRESELIVIENFFEALRRLEQ